MAHLQRNSVRVRTGDVMAVGDTVARVGNSGNTDEPHLHIHAQLPGTAGEPFNGDPVPIRFDGRYLARNDRFSVQ
jgi:murein DD-endopeptidase MepM/ murein hydrolase activator NlpD